VEHYRSETLGWETALSAAKRFSKGKSCAMGQGTGVDGSREPEIGGTFNHCYWVRVEGVCQEWVVRFPLKGITSDDTTLVRLRSEIATIQFLHQHTKVPVPAVIGYCEGDAELPPFMILESMDGIRMNLLLAADPPLRILDRVFKDLAVIQLELLSHPSERIGMLDLHRESSPPSPSLGPYSLDAMEHERDGVRTTPSQPFSSAHDYYNYKCDVWKQRLEDQQNSISSVEDGRRKLLDIGILKDSLNAITLRHDDAGPFYLTHPDLHSSNVILDRSTFNIVAIIDWEGACFLPPASSCTPPKAIFLDQIDCLSRRSPHYIEYKNRAMRYVQILSAADKSGSGSTLAEYMKAYLADQSVFLIWALDDVRYVDDMVWQHLAPRLYPGLKVRLDEAIANFEGKEDGTEDAIDDVFADFARERISEPCHNAKEVELWLTRKLNDLKEHDKQMQLERA